MKNKDRNTRDFSDEGKQAGSFDSPGRDSYFSTKPLRLLIVPLVTIFIAQLAIMLATSDMSHYHPFLLSLISGLLILILILPVLYFFVVKPMQSFIKEQIKLEKMIFEIEEREQRRIGQRLHNSLGQLLTGIAFQLKVLERKLTIKLPEEAEYAAEIMTHVNSAANEARLLAKDLRSAVEEEDSLVFSLSELASTTEKVYKVPCTFSHNDDIPIHDKAAATHLYRIAQEAIAYAMKGGQSGKIEVSLRKEGNQVQLLIQGKGRGNDIYSRQEPEIEIQIMKYRAHAIGASLDVLTDRDRGIRITCTYAEIVE